MGSRRDMEFVGDPAMQDGIGGSAVNKGDAWAESAFEAVFSQYYGRIVGVLYRMLGDRARAEELAAETFLRFFEQRTRLDRLENTGGWLYRTATRLAIDSLRSASRRQHYEQLAATDPEVAATPLDEVLRQETCREVRAALARLKPVQAQLLMLRSHGLAYKELAAALGLKPQSIGRLLMRAEAAFEKAYRRVAAGQRR